MSVISKAFRRLVGAKEKEAFAAEAVDEDAHMDTVSRRDSLTLLRYRPVPLEKE